MTYQASNNQKSELQAKLKKLNEEAIDSLCVSLAEGKSEKLEKFLDVMSRFPRYSFANTLLIMMQMPEATRIMGFNGWKTLKRHVKSGQSSLKIWAPIKSKRKTKFLEEQDQDKDDQAATEKENDFKARAIFFYSCISF